MLKFFRRIRQSLVQQNKFSRYLLYAFGEIILIVLGILIALGANNYNERQKAVKQSKVYLQDMLEDLASDTLYLHKMLPDLDKQLKIEDWMINKTAFDKNDVDSIKLSASKVNWSLRINDRSFQNILNSKDSKLFGYEELYSELSKYYILTKDRIAQNNQLEQQKSSQPTQFETTLTENLLINSRQYQDYSGFQVQLSMTHPSSNENVEKVLSSLSEIQTKNDLNETYARHNYLYVSLYFCRIEARNLIKQIHETLSQ